MAKFGVCISTEIDGANVPVDADWFRIDDRGALVFYRRLAETSGGVDTRAVFAAGKWVYFERLDE